MTDFVVIAVVVLAMAGLAWWSFGPKPTAEAELAGDVQEIRVRVHSGRRRARGLTSRSGCAGQARPRAATAGPAGTRCWRLRDER